MKPYVCKKHGPQTPCLVNRTQLPPLRLCPICRAARQAARRKSHREQDQQANWYERNKHKVRKKHTQYIAQIKAAVVAGYGGTCECCGETHPEFLTIDHIHGDGRAERKILKGGRLYRWLIENNFPRDRYRLLCMNCNFSRGKYGYCPHQRAQLRVV